MERPAVTPSIVILTAANLAPLPGVIMFGWDAAFIVLLYWTGNLMIGSYNILKMALLKATQPVTSANSWQIPFFSLHFGGFCAVHGFFLPAFSR